MNRIRKIIAAACVLALMLVMVPFAFADNKPGPADLKGCDNEVQYPARNSWLNSYETKYLKTRYGVRAYLRYGPYADSGYYDYVYEAAKVTVLARENGYSDRKSVV